MNQKIYERAVRFFSDDPTAFRVLHVIYHYLPYLLFVAYPALLIFLFFWDYESFWKVMLVPLTMLLAVSLLRILLNETRPYERYDTPSVFEKSTRGKSFPSRHTASAFVIAMAFLSVNVWLGVATLFVAVLIGCSRIFAGAHYFHDVLGGMVFGIGFGLILFFY